MNKPQILHHSDGDYVPKNAYDELFHLNVESVAEFCEKISAKEMEIDKLNAALKCAKDALAEFGSGSNPHPSYGDQALKQIEEILK